jgi:hypothetical protein
VYTGFWVGTPEGQRPLGRPRRSWEDNIKMDWSSIAQDRDRWWVLVNAVTQGIC